MSTNRQVVILGPPGAGKGTQAVRLAAWLGVAHVSTGDLFRHHVGNRTPLGREADAYMRRGDLVPDGVTLSMVADRLAQRDAAEGAVFDGFPRSVAQARALDEQLAAAGQRLDAALVLEVPREILVARLTGRRFCPQCQATYHIEWSPPAVADRCDRCGASLQRRQDDAEATVAHRLTVYETETFPLEAFYAADGRLLRVDGVGSVDAVAARLEEALGRD